METAHRL